MSLLINKDYVLGSELLTALGEPEKEEESNDRLTAQCLSLRRHEEEGRSATLQCGC